MNPKTKPYFVTIVTTVISDKDPEGYAAYRKELSAMVAKQPGFKKSETAVEGQKTISLTYWENEEAMAAWGSSPDHQEIKKKSHAAGWLKSARIEIAQVSMAIEIPPSNS